VIRRFALVVLVLTRFGIALLLAGLDTAWTILARRASIRPGLVEYGYEGLSPRGATVLSYFVSLTPGSTSVDLDLDRKRLVVHLLDTRHHDRAFGQVRLRFETPLRVLFPEGRP
jgi:multisubunit Na+/H+ antiporter MnhE subunit